MDEKFLFGVILGMVGGAFIVSNSSKARKLVKDGQEQIMSKVNEMKKSEEKSSHEEY